MMALPTIPSSPKGARSPASLRGLHRNAIKAQIKPTVKPNALNLGDFSWCIHEFDTKRRSCEQENVIPNPIEDPSQNLGSLLHWFVTPKESGKYTLCWKDAFDRLLTCFGESSHDIGCINNYSDIDGRFHTFPCANKCTFTPDEMASIQGCDRSKGIVTQGCNIFQQEWCQCPTGSTWDTIKKECRCTNPSHVTYYGVRHGDQSYGRGYCAPLCPEGYIYDYSPAVNRCVRQPSWY